MIKCIVYTSYKNNIQNIKYLFKPRKIVNNLLILSLKILCILILIIKYEIIIYWTHYSCKTTIHQNFFNNFHVKNKRFIHK